MEGKSKIYCKMLRLAACGLGSGARGYIIVAIPCTVCLPPYTSCRTPHAAYLMPHTSRRIPHSARLMPHAVPRIPACFSESESNSNIQRILPPIKILRTPPFIPGNIAADEIKPGVQVVYYLVRSP